jgi:hypothetical protein
LCNWFADKDERESRSRPVEKLAEDESINIVLISTLVVHQANKDSNSNNISNRKELFQSGRFSVTKRVLVDFSNRVERVV